MRIQINKITIHKGNDEQFPVFLLDEMGSPVSISGASAISIRLKNTDNSFLNRNAYTGMGIGLIDTLYIYGFSLTAAETALLLTGSAMDLVLNITFGSSVEQLIIPKSVTVLDAQ